MNAIPGIRTPDAGRRRQEAHAAAFTAAGWRVFDSDDEALCRAIASVLATEG